MCDLSRVVSRSVQRVGHADSDLIACGTDENQKHAIFSHQTIQWKCCSSAILTQVCNMQHAILVGTRGVVT